VRDPAPVWRSTVRGIGRAILGPARGKNLARAQEATTAVEFAVCALAMMLIVVGFVEFGRLAWTFEVLQDAAAEGARCMGLVDRI